MNQIKQGEKNQMAVENKTCSFCQRVLPLYEFHKRSATKDGRQYYCKDCVRKLNRQRYRDLALEGGPRYREMLLKISERRQSLKKILSNERE